MNLKKGTCYLFAIFLSGCAAHLLQHERAAEVLRTEEYDQKVKVQEDTPAAAAVPGAAAAVKPEETPPPTPPVAATSATPAARGKRGKKKVDKTKVSRDKEAVKPTEEGPRQPTIEDSVGMVGRRPIKDPFRPGEKVTLALSYFNVVAGLMDVEVKPFVHVNGEKAYHFEVSANSNSFFSRIYAVEDKASTYMSYERMTPMNLQISIKESKQLAETRTFFDWKTLRASYWQKKITKDNGEQSKKLDWDIKDYSQNVISAAYYMRIFAMEPGKNLQFRVADEGKNIVFKGEILRREKLQTKIGELDTIVMKPTLTVDGVFTPVGEIVFWLTDDDRKFIVRIESKIKIGTIVAKIDSLEKGQE